MKTARIFLMSLLVAGAMTFTACDSDVEVREGSDTTAIDVDNDMDTATSAIGTESVEQVVAGKLVLEPGFATVEVTSKPDGIIVLSGTTATEAEKMKAEEIAKGTDGVMSVENNITVAAP